jgi:hypothetical protein
MPARQKEGFSTVSAVVRSTAEDAWILRFARDVVPLVPQRELSLPERSALTEQGCQQAHVIKWKLSDMARPCKA